MNYRPLTERDGDDTLGVTRIELASATISAMLIVVGFLATVLFAIWVVQPTDYNHVLPPQPFKWAEGKAKEESDDDKLEEVSNDELPQSPQDRVEKNLMSLTDVISVNLAQFDEIEAGVASQAGDGPGMSGTRGGPQGEEERDVVPRWDRWQIKYSSSGLQEYARQLDYFNIELAAIGGGRELVDYAKNVSRLNPAVRQGNGKAEKRLYMTWAKGPLREFDAALLRKAGIPIDGRVTLQFYPKETENMLALLERENAGDRSVDEFQKTVFGVRRVNGGYEFYVMEQLFRRLPK